MSSSSYQSRFWQKVSFWTNFLYVFAIIVIAVCTFFWGRGYESSYISTTLKNQDAVIQEIKSKVDSFDKRMYSNEKDFATHVSAQEQCVRRMEESLQRLEMYLQDLIRSNKKISGVPSVEGSNL
jgi:peptidoglycan hydrolase CwlO-like protein